MIFGAKYKSFKIFVVVLGLIGATFAPDCQAERNPVSLDKQSQLKTLVSDKALSEFEAFKENRLHNRKRWNSLKQFVGQQATSANDRVVNSGLIDWLTKPNSPSKKQMVRQQTRSDQSIVITPSTLMVKLAGNMSAVQWWQVSNQITGLFDSIQKRVVQTSTKLHVDFQTSFLQLVKTSSSHLEQKVNDLAASSFVQGIFLGGSEQIASKPQQVIENVNEASSADPYWSYYSDCDFWGAEFNPADD